MHYRRLGHTGLEVSEIGFGAWGIGADAWKGASDSESLDSMRRAVELGVTFIDTAIAYGSGHSEELVGQIKRESPEVAIATKINPANLEWPAKHTTPADVAFSAEHVIERTEQSLRNLGLETIDLQQFHVWSDSWVDQGTWLEGIEKLKADGKIRFFGISVNDHEPESVLKLVSSGLVDSVQVIYNIFDQSPEDELLPLCERHDVGVIVRVPLDEGGLTGKVQPDTVFQPGDWREGYFQGERKIEAWKRVLAITVDLGVETERMPEMALRFCLSHRAVSTVIVGMRTVAHVEANTAVSDGEVLSADQIARLRTHRWVRNWYQS